MMESSTEAVNNATFAIKDMVAGGVSVLPLFNMENSTGAVDNTNTTGQSTDDIFQYVYFSISITGFALNILVIAVVTHRPFIQSKISRMLVVNQCVTDAFGALLSAIGALTTTELFYVPRNVIGDLICRLWWSDFLLWSFIQASVNDIMLFTIERYLSIVRPLTHQRISVGFTYFTIVLCWVMGLIINAALLFEAERSGDDCSIVVIPPVPYAVQGAITILMYVFPIALLIGLYSHMILVLKRRNRQLRAARRNHRLNEVSRDLIIIVAVATTAYTLLFAPETFIYSLYTFNVSQIDTELWVIKLYISFVNINFIVNPLVFVVFLRSFRRELRRIFTRLPAAQEATLSNRF